MRILLLRDAHVRFGQPLLLIDTRRHYCNILSQTFGSLIHEGRDSSLPPSGVTITLYGII